MIAHTIKSILQLVPEALPFIKEASITEESPLDSKDSCIASALQLHYFTKIAFHPVELESMEKLAEAVNLYGVSDIVKDLSLKMEKAAQAKALAKHEDRPELFLAKQASFEGSSNSEYSIKERSTTAAALYKEAQERKLSPSDNTILYSGNGYLNKEAAVMALGVRFNETKNADFVKLARAITNLPDSTLTPDLLVTISDSICEMDKLAGLNFSGHNFYKEAFFVKEAAFKSSLNVNLGGTSVPYESIEKVGKARISSYVGADLAKEMDGGPMHFKYALEALPRDLQKVVHNLTKNV